MLSPEETSALWLSFKVAGVATLVSLLPGIFFGWLLARREFAGKSVLDAVIHLPLVLPPVVPGYLLLLAFGANGVIGQALFDWFGISLAFNWLGAVLAAAVMGFPLLVQSVRLAIQLVDTRLENAARTLGAAPWRVFASITLPLALPGILVGALLGFSRSLGEFGATITFVGNIEGETRTLPLAIYSAVQRIDGEPMAMRLILISLALAFASLLLGNHLSRRAAARLGQGRHAEV